MSAVGSALRLLAVAGAVAALAASASSGSRPPPTGPDEESAPPPPEGRAMNPERALGLWKSSFGPVKIERDSESGPEQLMGVWVYDRAGQEVVGSFGGPLTGNVLHFRWQEPARPYDLTGEGYLVFDPSGRSFSGRWWTAARDRGGDWNGWRAPAAGDAPAAIDEEPPDGESPPEGEPPPGEELDEDEDRPRREGPAEQAPGPPPEDI